MCNILIYVNIEGNSLVPSQIYAPHNFNGNNIVSYCMECGSVAMFVLFDNFVSGPSRQFLW